MSTVPARAWRPATGRALYGPEGFYRDPAGPAGHFATSATAGPLVPAFATAVVRLAAAVDAALGHPEGFSLVDVGAGRGELLGAVAALAPPDRWWLAGVDLAPRPTGLPARITWTSDRPTAVTGLVVANEWLDTIPVDVAVDTPTGPRLLLVDETGVERPGSPVGAAERAWLQAWWPLEPPGRAEIGLPRDTAWAGLVSGLTAGLALAVDYAHVRGGRPATGSLAGYRRGRRVTVVPDGTCDITSHVAIDACAAAGRAAGATGSVLVTQRAALHALGLSGARPPRSLAARDPAAYARALASAAAVAELTDPSGLGGFWWLAQLVGCPMPPPLRAAA